MFCSKCGTAVPNDSIFCLNCGNRVVNKNAVPEQMSYTDNVQSHPNKNYGNAVPIQPYTDSKPRKCSTALIISIIAASLICTIVLLFVFGVIGFRSNGSFIADNDTGEKAVKESEAVISSSKSDNTQEASQKEIGISDRELIDYFYEIALNVEYGTSDGYLKRWEEPIRVNISGDYTEEDYMVLKSHIEDLNGLGILPKISIVDSDENFSVYFVPYENMKDTIPGYVDGNWGYFYLYWDKNYVINEAYMGIATDVTTQKARNHLILEEFTQALGLMNDSLKYEDSIFQSEWTETQKLSDIDYELLHMLYSDYLFSGMTESEVREVMDNKLDNILKDAA